VQKTKLTLAILLLAALFLPLSKCSRGGKSAAPMLPAKKSFAQQIFPRSDPQTDYDYGFKHLKASLHGLVSLVAFGWPFVLALLNRRAAGKRFTPLFYLLELLLSAGTLYWLYAVTVVGTRLWGAYVVIGLVAGYALAALVDLIGPWLRFKRREGTANEYRT
jgi:hypothetical protein